MDRLVSIIEEDVNRICSKINFEEIRNKTILVTGASGLLGGYFVACLSHVSSILHAPFKVELVMQSEPQPYLAEFLKTLNVSIYRGDLTDHGFCNSLPQADFIIHAAGYGQPGRFMENPVKTLKLNTSTVFSLFEKILPYGKFLFMSSSEVYSGSTNLPYRETGIGATNTTHPRACYIEAKRCGEAICNVYRGKGVNAKSARLALAYGPGTKKGDARVINAFIEKALGGNIALLDEGKAKRTYCYISDAVNILWHVLFAGKEPVYNIGGFSRTTIGDLAKQIGGFLNVPVVFPAHAEDMEGAPDDVSLDMTRVQEEFGISEYVPLDQGLRRTIEWQRALYNGLIEKGSYPQEG